jgi:hypothetical protein
MPEIKFTCSQCGQHISCDEAWAGHQLPCPACQNNLVVPSIQTNPTPARAPAPAIDTASAGRPKLSAGVTQVARAAPAGPAPQRRAVRPPKTTNPAIKFALSAVVLASIGVAALVYVPGLLKQAGEAGSSHPTGTGASTGTGPLGEVNGAMDVSDALDGSTPSRPRPNPARRPTPAPNTLTNHPVKTSGGTSSQAPGSR